MSAAPRHWAAINEVSFVAGMRLLFWIFRVLGRWPFHLLLYPVLCWYLLTSPRARRVSAAYLDRVRAYAPVPRLGVLRHFAAFAESILDKMLLWGGVYDVGAVTLHGEDAFNRMLACGQGGLLICSHFGNLELCRVLSRQRPDVKLTVLVHTRHAQAFNRMLARLNPDSQLNLMQVTELTAATAMQLSERVGRGELVVIAGDRVPVSDRPRVAVADFLGAPAAFPVGPYVLANALQCPVFLLFPLQRAGRASLHFEPFRASLRLPRQGRDAALAALAADYAARLQHYCAQAPLQWFNFYDFWHIEKRDTSDAPG
ncbi:LpxL/LpxP family acyltransferase [Pseudoduganella namucuonensis]|uniref:Predicted acyltransferase, LPLAT superfamily n=1 Tax=Pseudoduganella namucuonensis TaxID=1035707 RepID=A0A1I7IX84_9BURK|nr:acyltransferase [Pseudoduganella namucuonensis]SFU77540.1 Predicted acyltransferase, LPLAT superfamily [Pseudoduganella namucuonensis]